MALPSELSLKQLRYFAAAADAGQFSLAARQMRVSQSVVTTAIAQLETILGADLFERLPHGVALTAIGHRFNQHVRHALDTLQDAVGEPLFLGESLSGVVRLGASYTVLGYFLPGLLARFRRDYPHVDFDLIDMDRLGIERGVEAGELDLGLCITSNMDADSGLRRQVLARSRRQLWLAQEHPLAALPQIRLSDVAEFPYIMLTVDEGEEAALRYWNAAGHAPRIAFRTSTLEALRGLVAHGFGVSILSDIVYRPLSLEGRRIDSRMVADIVPPMEVGVVTRRDVPLAPVPHAFQQFLVYACSALPETVVRQ
jgi:DNA-binding transcriptional LysR family regulator